MSLNRDAILKGRRPSAPIKITLEPGGVRNVALGVEDLDPLPEKQPLHQELIAKFHLIQPLLQYKGDEYKLATGLAFGWWRVRCRWAIHPGWDQGNPPPTQPIKLVIVNHVRFQKFGFQVKLPAPLMPGETVDTLLKAPNLAYWIPGGDRHVLVTLALPAVERALRDSPPETLYSSELAQTVSKALTEYESQLRKITLIHCDATLVDRQGSDDD